MMMVMVVVMSVSGDGDDDDDDYIPTRRIRWRKNAGPRPLVRTTWRNHHTNYSEVVKINGPLSNALEGNGLYPNKLKPFPVLTLGLLKQRNGL